MVKKWNKIGKIVRIDSLEVWYISNYFLECTAKRWILSGRNEIEYSGDVTTRNSKLYSTNHSTVYE